jgi:LysR family hydrogen peroxide-inducible transcriptional activator
MRASPHPFTLRQLQYVVAVADHRNFRKAAAACRVSQPSLSAQIALVEDALGVRIFERDRRGVLVGGAGEQLVERMRRVLLDADDLVDAGERARDPLAGTLRIGVIPTVAPYLLPDIVPALREAFPRLTLVWIEEKTHRVREQLASGELDAGIVALESDLGDLARATIGDDPFVVALPSGHALGRSRKTATVDELADERVLLLDDGHCFRDQALSLCRRVGADEASVRATSLSTLAQIVASGGGVTLLPELAVATENRGGGLSIRRFRAPSPARTLGLVWRRRSPLEGALTEVASAMRKAYRASRPRR